LLYEPGEILNSSGKPFQVFTPFWNACCSGPEPAAPLLRPKRLAAPGGWPRSLALDELDLEPKVDWASGIRAAWTPGEKGAHDLLRRFVRESLLDYSDQRDRPYVPGTSRLSPHLRFGEISPRQIWHGVYGGLNSKRTRTSMKAVEPFLRQLGWREFSYHLLHHLPHTTDEPLRSDFAAFPWRTDEAALKAWQRGQTGYPLVDAGMRELWATGWMHNRVRMVVASFLVKDLLIPWQEGARWFWDTLVDADLANNTMGWQWTAGCGADAAPYFRVFNPVGQGERFDAKGDYVRRWVPELAKLPPAWIHRPWEAPAAVLAEAGIVLGKTYPKRIVVHAEARERALAAVATLKG
jgi:deoxyribodipyrimidine photo-lyase